MQSVNFVRNTSARDGASLVLEFSDPSKLEFDEALVEEERFAELDKSVGLEPEGWSHNEGGEIIEGQPQSKRGYAQFKYSRPLQAKDVWRMRVEVGGAARNYCYRC